LLLPIVHFYFFLSRTHDQVTTAGNQTKFIENERAAWKAWLSNARDYDAAELGIVPGSRGVVLTGPSKSVPTIIMTVLLLRETGCKLPVQYSYLRHEVSDEDLDVVRKFNISTRDFSDAIKDYDWDAGEYRLGGPKIDSILASPFEQVLFLDPDNYVVKDPTYLFETRTFQKYGALFWPDFPVRKNESSLIMWDVMGRKGEYYDELEFESGQIVLDKKKVWKALMLTKYIAKEARWYFQQFLGDKEAFFWGFAGTRTPYFLNPTYIHSVGTLVDRDHPAGSNAVNVSAPGSYFCGQSMLQTDFYDDPDDAFPHGRVPPPANFTPQPVFMHWNMLKYKYTEDVDYFQAAMTYVAPPGKRFCRVPRRRVFTGTVTWACLGAASTCTT
ncbi:mannosyltransferase putative-domain-containing protein, partial [Zopfochytrium polystomum]